MRGWIFLLVFLILISSVSAVDYYISPTGTASWSECQNINTPCSLLTANNNVAPGDTIYLRGGTYYPTSRSDTIHPGVSGTSNQRIIYDAYPGESAILDGTNGYEAILFSQGWNTGNPADGRNYITVRNLIFQNWDQICDFYFASYNEIDNCTFLGHIGEGMGTSYNGCFIYQNSSHNYIHDNTWHTFGQYVTNDQGTILNLGHDVGNEVNGGNDYNTIENNQFYAGGHHVFGVNNAKFNIIRNNYVHNEGWSTAGACADWDTGTCGYRVMSMTALGAAGSNLIENNYVAYGAQYGGPHLVSGASGSGLTVATPENIIRYNSFFGNVMFGLRFGSSIAGSNSNKSHVFSNTFYYNGWNMDSWGVVNEDDPGLNAWGDPMRGSLSFYTNGCSDARAQEVVVKNNLAHESWSETNTNSGSTYYPAFYTPAGVESCNTITNNYGNTASSNQANPFTPYPDPLFVDPDITDPMSLTLVNGEWVGKPDLSLQSGSPAIDGAIELTNVATSDSGTGITLRVDDALYFQDGSWGSDLTRNTIYPDWIAVGSVDNIVEIQSIDYDNNIITLANSISRSDGDDIWLYSDSTGNRVLYGSAPDYGAYEYEGDLTIEYYVDPDFVGPSDGSASRPWTNLDSDNAWTIINDALISTDVIVYFSAREAGSDAVEEYGHNLQVKKTISARNNHLTLDGMSKYNSDDNNPNWLDYSGNNKLKLIGESSLGLGWPLTGGLIHDVTLRGFEVTGNVARVLFGGNNLIVEHIYSHDIINNGATFQTAGIADESCNLQNNGERYSNVTIRNNYIENGFGESMYIHGIYNWCTHLGNTHSNFIVENNVIINAGANGGQGDAIEFKFGFQNITIRNNTIINSGNIGISIGAMSYEEGSQNVVIEKNEIIGSQGRAITLYSDVGYRDGVLIRNNIIANNDIGIIVYGAQGVSNIEVYSNTIYGNVGPGLSLSDINGLTVKNNLVFANNQQWKAQASNFANCQNIESDYNMYSNGTWPYLGEGSNTLFIDDTNSLVVDPINSDFHLKQGSDAIDNGIDLSSTGFNQDIEGTLRPQGSAWDIGAYEYLQTSNFHEADTNTPFGVIDITELMIYITDWKYGDGSILMGNVIEAISHWKAGSY